MIKICYYDLKKQKFFDVFTELNSYAYYKKYCRRGGVLFIAWSSKKNNFNCWHYCVGLK